MKPRKAALLLSGGIDSTTTLARMAELGLDSIHAFIFDYGQTLAHEVDVAAKNADHYGADIHIICVDLRWTSKRCVIFKDNPGEIPKDRTQAEIDAGTPPSYVPFRNGIFFSLVGAWAESNECPEIWAGCNGLHSGQYPDDTEAFGYRMQAALQEGTAPGFLPSIILPFANTSKVNVVAAGLDMGVDYSKTFSCYTNLKTHCGHCDSCLQRRRAFEPFGLDLEGHPV